jgi:serine/threonine protein kinase
VNWELPARRVKLLPVEADLDLAPVQTYIDQIASLIDAAKQTVLSVDTDPKTENPSGPLKRLSEIGVEASKGLSQWRTLTAKFRASTHDLQKTMPDVLKRRVASAMEKLSADTTFYAGLAEFQNHAREWRTEQLVRIEQAFSLALQLQDLASEIEPTKGDRLKRIVANLFDRLEVAKLTRLLTATTAEAEKRKTYLRGRAAAASEVIGWLNANPDAKMTDENRVLILTLVENNNLEEAERLLASLQTGGDHSPETATVIAEPTGLFQPVAIASTEEKDEPQATLLDLRNLRTTPFEFPMISGTAPQLTPRNRVTAAKGLPDTLSNMCAQLMTRALEELERGSVLGVLDHVLDLLAAITAAEQGRDRWLRLSVALLTAMPAAPPFDGDWGRSAAAEFIDRLNRELPSLEQLLSDVLQQPRLDDVISQRFFYKEFLPFASTLGEAVYKAVANQSPHTLEDVAAAVGLGSLIGDPVVALTILTELARASQAESDLATVFETTRRAKRMVGKVAKPPALNDWIWEALQRIAESSDRRPPNRQSASDFHVIVVPSVSRKGGIPYQLGGTHLDLVLYVNLLHDSAFGPVELSISQSRNQWLAGNHVCFLGCLEPGSPVVVPIRAELAGPLDPSEKLQLQYQLSFKELGSGDTKIHDGRHQPSLSEPRPIEIEGYSGATGSPLILVGDSLKFSSASVRSTLGKLSAGLKAGPLAALIVGRRRRGKTSILETICKDSEISSEYRIVFDKFESMPAAGVGEAMQRLGIILDRLARKLDLTLDPIQDRIGVRPNTASAVVQEWLEAVTDSLPGPACDLILIDEFQKWLSRLLPDGRTQVLLLLRTLVNRPLGEKFGLSVILSGLSDLKEHQKASADFKNLFPSSEIKCFTAPETAALLRSNPTIDYDVRAVRLIHELTGGNPFLVNLLGDEVATHLRDLKRSYCLATDVENVVDNELADKASSRVWSFVEYLLRKGEEDQAAMIDELPAVEALAWSLQRRGTKRRTMRLAELHDYLCKAGVSCDGLQLEKMIERAVVSELLVKSDRGYAFSSRWVGDWLSASASELPRGINASRDPSLVLNHYRIIEKLSTQGAQAEVYRAEDVRHVNSQFLLKIYPRRHDSHSPAIVQREVASLRQVNHEGVVKCIFSGVDEEKGDVLVLEWVNAPTLRKLISSPDATAERLIGLGGDRDVQLKFIEQLAAALAECHRLEIVHKDLKPENIMVIQWAGIYLPKIIDFGLASQPVPGDDSQGTLGPYTYNYVSPERLRGEPRNSAADVFSLGVVAYELLTGMLPYEDTLNRDRTVVPLSLRRSTLGTKVTELLESMLADDPAARPTAAYLAAALPDATVAQDWKESHNAAVSAVLKNDYGTALTCYMRAVACTPEPERASSDFAQLLRDTLESATTEGRMREFLPQLVQPALRAICNGEHKSALGSENPFEHLGQTLMNGILSPASESRGSLDGQGQVIQYLIGALSDAAPSGRLAPILLRLLEGIDGELIWAKRNTLFDIAVRHRLAATISDHVIYRLCLRSASRCRQVSNGSLVEAGIWLRRADRMGGSNGTEFQQEAAELQRLTSVSASSSSPPPPAKQVASDKCIGENERPHCNADRVMRWVDRLQRRFDFVEQVKRLEADAKIDPRPCRLLDPDKAAKHFTKVLAKDRSRVIPAVLDDTHHKGAIALRINIWLAEGCTIAQRDNAIELLKTDRELFGDAAI